MAEKITNGYYNIALKGSEIERCLTDVHDNKLLAVSDGIAHRLIVDDLLDDQLSVTNKKYVQDELSKYSSLSLNTKQLKVGLNIINYIDNSSYSKIGGILYASDINTPKLLEPRSGDAGYLLRLVASGDNLVPSWELESRLNATAANKKSDIKAITGLSISPAAPWSLEASYSEDLATVALLDARLVGNINKDTFANTKNGSLIIRDTNAEFGYSVLSAPSTAGKVLRSKSNNAGIEWSSETSITKVDPQASDTNTAITGITPNNHELSLTRSRFVTPAELEAVDDKIGDKAEFNYEDGELTIKVWRN